MKAMKKKATTKADLIKRIKSVNISKLYNNSDLHIITIEIDLSKLTGGAGGVKPKKKVKKIRKVNGFYKATGQ